MARMKDVLDTNFERIKTYLNNHGSVRNGERYTRLKDYYDSNKKNGLKNFTENQVMFFADWGYKFEDFDFAGDQSLISASKKGKRSRIYGIIFAIILFGTLPTIGIINRISKNVTKNNEQNHKECSSKLIRYAWTEKDGCQKANFNSKRDCLRATFGKTYYYNQETYSYNKYYEYDYDPDLYDYNKSGVRKYSTNNVPSGKGEYYITCLNDGSWHTNTFNSITEPVDYWQSVKKDLF